MAVPQLVKPDNTPIRQRGSVDGAAWVQEHPPGSVSDYSGSTNATPGTADTIDFGGTSQSVELINDGSASVLISLDDLDTPTWLEVKANEARSFNVARAAVKVKSASASVPYRLAASY